MFYAVDFTSIVFNYTCLDSSSSSTSTSDSSSESSSGGSSSSIDYSSLEVTTLSSNSISIGSYSTGNYSNHYTSSEVTTIDNIAFQHYRAVSASGVCKLLPYYANSSDGTIAGALYNSTKINNLYKISITYSNSGSASYGGKVYYGDSFPLSEYKTLSFSDSSSTQNIEIDGYSYFRVETSGCDLTINSLSLYYESASGSSATYANVNDGEYRINPVVYEGTPTSGATVEIPTSITPNGSSYTVNSTKTLTYYTTSDVTSGNVSAETASLTDPFDVAAYYVAFGSAPANYVSSTSGNTSVFGSYLRKISSKYTRTDGYVNAVPGILEASNFSSLGYYELDIAIDSSYSTSSRGVGRVIVFPAGVNADGYNSSTYAVFRMTIMAHSKNIWVIRCPLDLMLKLIAPDIAGLIQLPYQNK